MPGVSRDIDQPAEPPHADEDRPTSANGSRAARGHGHQPTPGGCAESTENLLHGNTNDDQQPTDNREETENLILGKTAHEKQLSGIDPGLAGEGCPGVTAVPVKRVMSESGVSSASVSPRTPVRRAKARKRWVKVRTHRAYLVKKIRRQVGVCDNA